LLGSKANKDQKPKNQYHYHSGNSSDRELVKTKVLPDKQRKSWVKYLGDTRVRLGLEKQDSPFDLVGFIRQTSATFTNPIVQCFQTGVKVLDKDGKEVFLRFPAEDTIEHIKIAQESGNFLVLQIYLEACTMGRVTQREALQAITLLETFKHNKPLGFNGLSQPISSDRLKEWCNGILVSWIAQNGDVEMATRSKKRASSRKTPFYMAIVDAVEKPKPR